MKIDRANDIAYAGLDPREIPAYSVAAAARFLGLPPSTLRRWFATGRLAMADRKRRLLSFRNLVVAYELEARRQREPARWLDRIARDSAGAPVALYPYSVDRCDSRPVVIDPFVGFGQPTIAGTGIASAVVAGRRHAGESLRRLALDYARPVAEIRAAVRYEGLAREGCPSTSR